MTSACLRRNLFMPFLLLVSACNPVKTIDSIGDYMPVIGDRCEHWQCITASGQAQSDAIKASEKRMEALKSGQVPPTPPQPQAQALAPAQAAQPQTPTPPPARRSTMDRTTPPWGNDPYDTYRP